MVVVLQAKGDIGSRRKGEKADAVEICYNDTKQDSPRDWKEVEMKRGKNQDLPIFASSVLSTMPST